MMKPIVSSANDRPLSAAQWVCRMAVVVSVALLMAYHANGQDFGHESLAAEAAEVRSALGFGPEALVAIGVSPDVHFQMIEASLADVAIRTAQDHSKDPAVQDPVGWVADPSPTEKVGQGQPDDVDGTPVVQPQPARLDLAAVLRSHLTPEQQMLHDRMRQNGGLEVPFGLLGDLNDQQRQALRAVCDQRIAVLNDVRNWHRRGVRRRAEMVFELQVQQVLNRAQQAELEVFRQRLDAGLGEALLQEIEVLQVEAERTQAARPDATIRLLPVKRYEEAVGRFLQLIGRSLRHLAGGRQQASRGSVPPGPQANLSRKDGQPAANALVQPASDVVAVADSRSK